MLIGDADQYGTLRPMTGTVLPVAPEQLVLPAGTGRPVTLGPSSLPDEAVICNCHNVTKGAICEHSTLPEVKKCTKAGTGCGSCLRSSASCFRSPRTRGCATASSTPAVSCTRSSAPSVPRRTRRCSTRTAGNRRGRGRLRGLQADGRFDHRLAGADGRRERLRPGRRAGSPAGHQRPLPGQPPAQRVVLDRAAHPRW
ncbi:(2Fe-2S)-binding protein [Streptomyces sp. M10(2022)]